MNHEFAQVLNGSRWLMEPTAFRAMVQRAAHATPEAIQAAVQAYGARDAPQMVGDVAVIDVTGPITYKPSWFSMYFGGACIRDLQTQFRMALADPAVKTIVFRMDSPGGMIDMVSEFADEIFAARGAKPILVVADPMIASAAYWLASSADTIYATVSSQLGAIGVYCEHEDISAMLEKAGVKITLIRHGVNKATGTPYEPLADDVRAQLQANVDEIGGWFDAAVARGRGVSKAVVLETFGQGQVFRGKQAIALGLADKLGTINQVMARLTKGRAGAASAVARAAIQAEPVISAKTATADEEETGCDTCDPECPCEQDECPEDCPDCSPECACVKASTKAKAEAESAAVDADAILVVLS